MKSREAYPCQKTEMRVFLFHAVTAMPPSHLSWRERKYWLSVAEFRSHLTLLRTSHQVVADLEEAWSTKAQAAGTGLTLGPSRPPASVVLTFDDGHSSDAVVWSILCENRWSATFFVNTATLDQPGYLDWRTVREMSDGGARFGSHGHQHLDLTSLRTDALRSELRKSKDLLETWIHKQVHFLAVPYGRVTRRVTEAALEAGYRAVCTSAPWPATPGSRSVNRVAIHSGVSAKTFRGLLRGDRWPYWMRRARANCLALPKRLLPPPASRAEIEPEAVR